MEHNVSAQQMDSLKALTDTNMKVSEAKGALMKIKEMESAYLADREKKAVTVVTDALAQSEQILNDTTKNYAEVRELATTAWGLADKVVRMHDEFAEIMGLFDQKSALWEAQTEAQKASFVLLNKQISLDRAHLANDREAIDARTKRLTERERKLADDRGALERAITRLKAGKI